MHSPNLLSVLVEDAEACNDLSQLLPKFKHATIILGAIKVARSAVESVESIEQRTKEALKYIPSERLVLAPDCGLGFLTEDMINEKLRNMVQAANAVV